MRILLWNCNNGLGSKEQREYFFSFKPDIAIIPELKEHNLESLSPENSIWVTSLNHETFDVIAKCHGYTLKGIEKDHMICSLPFKVIELSTKDLMPINIYTFNENKAAFPTVALPDGDSVWVGSFSLDRLVSFKN